MEAGAGIEPAIEVLQTSALPLGYPAIFSGGIGGMREETKGFRSAIRAENLERVTKRPDAFLSTNDSHSQARFGG